MELHFEPLEALKNNPNKSVENNRISEGIFMVRVENKEEAPFTLRRDIDQSLIQFYFAAQGSARFLFSGGHYQLQLSADKSLLFYNPLQHLPLNIEVAPGSQLVFLYITVEKLHSLFVAESDEIAFLNSENIDQKFYADVIPSPALMVVIGQFFQNNLGGHALSLFYKAKVYEIFARYFNREEGIDVEQCPFLKDEENVARVREAKQIIVERYSNPPTIKELSGEIGLNEYRLKAGFKNIYGKTVFQFLNDYRLDVARKILDEGTTLVNDTAYQIGYANPSHFIGAFRKKFGVTPKKYLQNK